MLDRALPSVAAALRRFGHDTHAVSEVVGYLLTFAIAVTLLVAALQTFSVVQDYSQDLAAGTVAEDIANRIVYAVLQATDVAQRLPNVDYEFRLGLPTEIRGRPYRIEMTQETVYVNETGGMNASAPLLNAPATLLLCNKGWKTNLADGTCYVPGHTPDVTIAYAATTRDSVPATGVFFRKTG